MTKNKKCIGFADKEKKCENAVDWPLSHLWCKTCEDARREHISKKFAEMDKKFGGEKKT